jgi:hypothetical protein
MDKLWCEEYKDFYGNSDPNYGGVLTDLRTLPVGTEFYVTNGAWYGEILSDNRILIHGLKTDGIVELTDNHHSLYIEY